MCESYNRQYGRNYRSIMPTNLYGPGDNYHAENSHVVPALIRRFHDAKKVGYPKLLFGALENLSANFFMLMTWPKQAFLYITQSNKC